MPRNSDEYNAIMVVLLMVTSTLCALAIYMMLISGFALATIMFAGLGVMACLEFKAISRVSKGPIQELEILVDLPAGTDVKVAPLLLNSVDSALLSYLLGKCTRTIDQGKTLLHYKDHGEIYHPQRSVFQIKGALYKPTRLKVVYCSPP